ncbi:GNAT family N-acetyltransferase [Daejeonia sp. YH14]|uniref:GNAT family N-acetyltransferase n=1 Tax=Daejeonia sp. YH14 TaxID=3439042 RepID=UPI003F4934F0
MNFIPVIRHDQPEASLIYNAYCKAFPENERRSKEQYLRLFDTGEAEILLIKHETEKIGYLILWKLSDCVYIEHFEIFPEFRSRKFGSLVLRKLHQIYPETVLESEPEDQDDIAERRIRFYERNGFHIIDREYIQPSYGEGKKSLRLYLLSTVRMDAGKVSREIHRTVYGAH